MNRSHRRRRARCRIALLGALAGSGLSLPVLLGSPAGAGELCDPTLLPDNYSTPSGTTLDVPAPGVAQNDTLCPNGNPLTLSAAPSFGLATLSTAGALTYTPNPGFVGADQLTYSVDDSNGRPVTATVDIFVFCDVQLADDAYETEMDTTLDVAAPGVGGNDETCGNSIFVWDDVSNGTLSLNGDGSFTYVPDAGFVGTDTFTYAAFAQGLERAAAGFARGLTHRRPAGPPEDLGSVTITVNAPAVTTTTTTITTTTTPPAATSTDPGSTVPTTGAPTTPAPTTVAPTTVPGNSGGGGALPETGSGAGPPVAIVALAALATGALVVIGARRRV
jgi:hypothetical protein